MKNIHLTSITRKDLGPGTQSCQSSHAMVSFCKKYPQLSDQWHSDSNYMCQLSVENEKELQALSYKLQLQGIKVFEFREPDINNELTSICFIESKMTKKFTNKLPLMLSEYNVKQVRA